MALIFSLITCLGLVSDQIDNLDVSYLYNSYKLLYIEAGVLEPEEHYLEYITYGSTEAKLYSLNESIELMVWRLDNTLHCPPISDKLYLPDKGVAYFKYKQASLYTAWLLKIAPFLSPLNQSKLAIFYKEQKYREDVWWQIYYIQCGSSREGSRYQLQILKDLVGKDNYENQRWPEYLIPSAYGTWKVEE